MIKQSKVASDSGPFQSLSAAGVGLAECGQPLSDKLVLLQHLGDGPENYKLGLSKTEDALPEKKEGEV